MATKKVYRSAETGTFVSKETADKFPNITYGSPKSKTCKKKSVNRKKKTTFKRLKK